MTTAGDDDKPLRRSSSVPDDHRNAWPLKRQIAYLRRGYSVDRLSALIRSPNEPTEWKP